MPQVPMRISATTIGSPDPPALGAFYARMLDWRVIKNDPEWVMVRPPSGGTGLSFQLEDHFERPVWPAKPGEQQMMMHLDIGVPDFQAGVDWAVECGATPAEFQPQEHVRVMLDPDGHPFCLFPSPS